MKAVRWSDHDRYLGPFTWCRNNSYVNYGAVLESAGEESPSSLRLHFWKWTLCIRTPDWLLRPHREKVYPGWDWQTVERLGRDWYWNIDRRSYGFNLSGSGRVGDAGADFLSVYLGRHGGSCMDSNIEQRWSYFLPWKSWRHVRHSYYGLKGEWLADALEWSVLGADRWEKHRALEDAIPVRRYRFKDYDGEELAVSVRIEEREWRRGEGWWKWLSWFWRPMIVRSACFEFSGETGKRKGSWKGGTIGSSIELKYRGDLHLDGFVKYCKENQMKFTGIVVDDEPPTGPEAA